MSRPLRGISLGWGSYDHKGYEQAMKKSYKRIIILIELLGVLIFGFELYETKSGNTDILKRPEAMEESEEVRPPRLLSPRGGPPHL